MKWVKQIKRFLCMLTASCLLASFLSIGGNAAEQRAPLPPESEETEAVLPDAASVEPSGEAAVVGDDAADAGFEEAEEDEVETETDRPALDAAPGGGQSPGGGGGSSAPSWTGAASITSGGTYENGSYSSVTDQQNALLISTSGSVTLNNPTAVKTGGGGNSDPYSFYGINAAVMVKGGTTTTILGGTVTTSADGANGVFCYGGNGGKNGAAGDGTTLIIRDTKITTTAGGSGGIMTTGGGITYAYDLDVTTGGRSSAPIRTDRGGGTVVVDGGTYVSNGLGSPAVYSTASVTVKNASLVSNLSEGVCIEGKNSITLENCDLTANNTSMNGNARFLDTIMIYQSMSGDSSVGGSNFTMKGGSLTSKCGHVFHVTNTTATIDLENVDIRNEYSSGVLLSVCDDGWSGASNIATLNARNQSLSGGLLVGSNSALTLNLTDHSDFYGCTVGNITNYKGATVSTSIGKVYVTIDDTSTWTLYQDSYVTSFAGDPANVIANGHTLYVNGVPLEGTSASDPLDVDENGLVDLHDAVTALKKGTAEYAWIAVQVLDTVISA